MKTRYIFLLSVALSISLFSQGRVERFDGTWTNLQDLWWSEGSELKEFSYDSTFKYEGAASLKIEWMNKTYTDWQYAGVSFANNLGANEVINIADYDSLVFWMYVERPAKQKDTYLAMIFVENPSDVSHNSNPTGSNGYAEFWRHQYNYIFNDTSKTWKRISVPLKVVGNTSDPKVSDWNEGWNRQSVGGKKNNTRFDLEAIRGFYLEFDSDSVNTYDSCVFYIDNMMAIGKKVTPLVLFNGRRTQNDVSMAVGWSGSVTVDPVEDFDSKGTGAVKWIGDDGWDGVWWDFANPRNLGANWKNDTVQFAIKAPAGFGTLYVALADADEGLPDRSYQAVYTMTETSVGGYNGNWKLVKIPLKDFEQWGSWDPARDKSKWMDSSKVTQFRIEGDGQVIKDKVVYFDNIWTGKPTFDITAPAAPSGVVGLANGKYINTVSWTDIATETQELYNIYQSTQLITSVKASGVTVAKLAIAKGVGLFDQDIRVPKNDQTVDFYYAVTCVDSMGNESAAGVSAKVTNTAKGITVISPTAPPSFVADGNLSEWATITPFRMNPKDKSGSVVSNTKVTDSLDLNVKAYVAFDNANMYVAFDVIDDIVLFDSTFSPGWKNDSPELFIGLYDDSKGIFRWFYGRGAEPNYHLRFGQNEIHLSHWLMFDKTIMRPGVNYSWKKKGLTPGYTVEAKIPLALLASEGDDDLFVPKVGMQMPIDFAINDADSLGYREGIMTYSPSNEDNSWAYVTGYWTSTWLGGYATSVRKDNSVAQSYELWQNFPNPFNPSTEIRYSIAQSGMVRMKMFDILGREVATIVNEYQTAGTYTARVDASLGRKLASGVYFYTVEAGSFHSVKKMMLLK
ncbi:MAG: sugar-binding protein [Bacteroidota bacterium]|nr:sugar-binding protein [Bacteroidota bacterium]